MVKAVIFDMDGVLVDNQDIHIEAFHVICKKYGVPFNGREDFMKLFGMGNEQIMAVLLPEQAKTMGWRALADEKESLYREIFEKIIAPVKGLPEFLHALKAEGYKIAVGSSGSKENVEFVLEKCHIGEYFDVIVNGDMVTHCKPDPEIYLTTAEKLGLKPEECAVVEGPCGDSGRA